MPWQTLDFRIFKAQAPIVSTPSGVIFRGVAIVQFPAVPGNQLWRVEQIQVAQISPTPIFWPGLTASVFDQSPDILYLDAVAPYGDTGYQQLVPVCDVVPVDSTLAGNGDSAEYSPAITVTQGNQLTVVFVSPFNPEAQFPLQASVRLQVMVMGGVAGQPTAVAGSQPAPSIPASL